MKMALTPIAVIRHRDDYREVIEWCLETFSDGKNGRYDVIKGLKRNQVLVYLTPYTEEAATLITLKWLS